MEERDGGIDHVVIASMNKSPPTSPSSRTPACSDRRRWMLWHGGVPHFGADDFAGCYGRQVDRGACCADAVPARCRSTDSFKASGHWGSSYASGLRQRFGSGAREKRLCPRAKPISARPLQSKFALSISNRASVVCLVRINEERGEPVIRRKVRMRVRKKQERYAIHDCVRLDSAPGFSHRCWR